MESKRKIRKKMKQMLEKLREKAVINPNARCTGKPQQSNSPMSKKDKKRKGRVTPKLNKGTPIKYLIEGGLEPQKEWNNWTDYRDGRRDWGLRDKTKIKKESLIKRLTGGKYTWDEVAEEMEKDTNNIRKKLAIRKARKRKTKGL